jgi:sarcosine oxidase subunit gamma
MHKFLGHTGSVVRVQTWDVGAAVPVGLEDFLGILWPRGTGDVASARPSGTVICVAPGEWLVMGGELPAATLVARLRGALEESTYRATDVSQALLRVQIDGNGARGVLGKGCSLDFDAKSFGVGRAARTRLAGIPVVVWRVGDDAFECLLTRSYGEYFGAWLEDAALEFEAGG